MRSSLIVLVLAFTACIPTKKQCDLSTCASGCCDLDGACQMGNFPTACGSAAGQCTTCLFGQQCIGGACSQAQPSCLPKTCASLGKNCGEVADGCGGTLQCGTCLTAGTACGAGGMANVCAPGSCTPKSCTELNAACGRPSDGCSALLDCGQCQAGSSCTSANTCTACVPTTCAALGKNCGSVSDGCGGTLSCGTCTSPNSCGGGGTANVCGQGSCTPTTCLTAGKNCGSISDNCGGMLSCGSCTSPQTCAGAGVANVCGAACRVSCPGGFSCDQLGQCSGGNIGQLVLNEVSYPVSGTVTVDGVAPTKDATYCAVAGNVNDQIGVLSYTESTKGYSGTAQWSCSSSSFDFALTLPPGTYSFRVARGTYSTAAGVNLAGVNYLAAENVVVNGPVTNLQLAEVTHVVSGTVTVNGAAPTKDATYCSVPGNVSDQIGVLGYQERTKGYSGSAQWSCSSSGWGFSLNLAPGTYDFRVARGTYSAGAGVNLLGVNYLAATGVVVNGPITNLVLAEVGVQVSGSVTVNGAAPTKDATYCAVAGNVNDQIGVVSYQERTKGYSGSAQWTCSSSGWGFSLTLPPGTYDFRVARGTYSAAAGVNLLGVNYLAASGVVVGSTPVTNLQLAEVGVQVSGSVTVNGAAPTKDATYCAVAGNVNDQIGVLSYSEPTKGYSGSVQWTCSSAGWNFSLVLPPGTYDFRVARGTYSAGAGVNLLGVNYLAATGVVVGTAPVMNLVLAEVGHQVSGVVTVNGQPPTKDAAYCQVAGNVNDQIGVLTYSDAAKGYSGSVQWTCSSTGWAFSLLLPPGTYDFRVSRGTYSAGAGVNLLPVSYLAASAVVVSAPIANLMLAELGRMVSGSITVNGQPPTKNAGYCAVAGNLNDQIGVLRFSDPTRGYSGSVQWLCSSADWSFNLTLPPGVYDFRVDRGTYSGSAGVNLVGVSYLAAEKVVVP